MSRGFTLVELLVVIVIVMLVSVVTLPTVISSWRERSAVSGASLLQASIDQAKAEATAANAPRGIRFLPDETVPLIRLANGRIDPTAPLACNRWVALETPGTYSEGRVSIYAGFAYDPALTGGLPCLVLEQSPGHWEPSGTGYAWVLNSPTNWPWVIRIGDRVTLGAGAEYCVCGPMVVSPAAGNSEQFVNYGAPGAGSPIVRTYLSPDGNASVTGAPEYLLLVNGRDDNRDGFPDNGWDGIDNDGINGIDDAGEWIEVETWHAAQTSGIIDAPYSIRRRPAPSSGSARTVIMPGSLVLDLSTWGYTYPNRSRLLVNEWTGAVDVMVAADGRILYDLPYSAQSSVGMGRGSLHFWLGDKSDIPATIPAEPTPPDQLAWSLPPAKEDMRLVTLSRTGVVAVSEVNPDDPAPAYLRAQRGH